MNIREWKLSKNEKKVLYDALDGGSFYEEAQKTAFGWASPVSVGISKEEFLHALSSLKAKGYVTSYSETDYYGREKVTNWWLMSMVGVVEVDRDDPNPFCEEDHDEMEARTHKVESYESQSEKVKLGDIVLGYEVKSVEGRRLNCVVLENDTVITFGLWTNRTTVEEKIQKAKQ